MTPSAARRPIALGSGLAAIAVLGAIPALLAFTIQPALLAGLAVFIGLALAAMKVRSFPVVCYWVLISFVSVTTLDSQFRIQVGEFPIGLTEFAAGLLLFGCLFHAPTSEPRPARLAAFHVGLLLFLGWSAVSALLGFARGNGVYPLLIDLRVIAYVYLGYWAARTLLPLRTKPGLLTVLTLLTGIGFAAQQLVVSARGVASGLALSIINQRDIGVPFFTGRYGILMSAGLLQSEESGKVWWALPSLIVGLAAMALSFVRTGWLATATGLLALMVLGGRVGRMARYACILGMGLLILTITVPEIGALGGIVGSRAVDVISPSSPATDTVAARLLESQQALAALKSPLDWLAGAGLGLGGADSLRGNQHNSFVWLLSKEGVIGLGIFLLTFAAAPALIAARSLGTVGPQHRTLVIVLLSAHLSNLVSGYASGHLTLWPYCPIVGMTVGWLTSPALREAA